MTTSCPDPIIIKNSSEIEAGVNASNSDPLHDASKLPLEDVRDNFDFTEKTMRHAFIRKVYSILMIQLLISAAFIAGFKFNKTSNEFIQEHPGALLISLITTFVLMISMSCCATARRVPPLNYICLFVFTIAESFLLSAFCIHYESNEVLIAVGICAIVCFIVIVFAFQTKYDFTTWGIGLFIVLCIMFLFALVLCFIPSNVGTLIYAAIGCFVFSFCLLFNTQALMGGKHKYTVSPEEYVFAALNLYLDIVQIFMVILRLVTGCRG